MSVRKTHCPQFVGLTRVAALIFCVTLTCAASPMLIGVNFTRPFDPDADGPLTVYDNDALAPTDLVGAPGAPQQNWNNVRTQVAPTIIGSSTNNLVDSTGLAVTGLTVSVESGWSQWSISNGQVADDNFSLMNNYIYASLETKTITLSGIPDGGRSYEYELYLYYGATDGGRLCSATVGDLTFYGKTSTSWGSYVLSSATTAGEAGNATYFHFTGLHPSGGTLVISFTDNPGGASLLNTGVFGLQLLVTSVSPSGMVFSVK